MKLTEKEKAFIKHYPVDMNGNQAAIKAGYSPRCARQQSFKLLKKPEIRDAIRLALEKRARKYEAEADQVIKDLADIAFIDKSQVFRVKDGELIVTDTDLIPERVRRCISKISQTQHGLRIEFDDRVKALELLGRHLALFTDNLNVNGNLKTKSIDDMTEEEIDAELARIEGEKAEAGEEAGASANQSA